MFLCHHFRFFATTLSPPNIVPISTAPITPLLRSHALSSSNIYHRTKQKTLTSFTTVSATDELSSTSRTAEADTMLRGQEKILQLIHGVMDAVAIKCALELRIADIIDSHGGPITLSRIADSISSSSLNIDGLSRLMRFLVHRQVFDEMPQPDHGEKLYSLNNCSKWLLHDPKMTLAPYAMMVTNPILLSPLYNLNQSITQRGTTIEKIIGKKLWDLLSLNPEYSRIFNEGMKSRTRIAMDAILSSYGGGFHGLEGTLVDVGGGLGVAISEIVHVYPHLKGINFDLPHVIATAPTYDGVTHVGGNMFEAIPPADSIFLKNIMHDWGDADCIKILKNCRKSISTRNGKLIIVDVVLHDGGDDLFDNTRLFSDLSMLVYTGGRERTEAEWKKIFEEADFRRYNIIKIPTIESIIEVYSD